MPEIDVAQGRENTCKCYGFHDLGLFDEAPGTLHSPGVRADAQYFKSTWLEELALDRNIIQA